MSKPKQIKPIDGFANVTDGDLVSRATSIQTGMTGNTNFPNPPADLTALKTAIETFSALIAEALDGSKKVIAQKHKQRLVITKMLKLLGRYVEVTSNGDMAIFQTSGFQAAAPKTAPVPLTEKIRKVEHGPNSGQITVWLKGVAKASSYEVRYAVANATAPVWNTAPASSVKQPLVLTGLTPATTYLLQARALIKGTFTDYSDSISFICT
jgi:hypothetical protein